MSGRLRSIVTIGVIAGATLALYTARLGPPPPLSPLESILVRQAQSVAATGRDSHGRFAPLFFQESNEVWLQPIPVYSAAAVIAVTSSEWGARFATVCVTVLSALLMHLVARRLLRHEGLAVTASGLMVLTPALFAYSRTASDGPYSLPFVLAWLLWVVAYLEKPRAWPLALAGLALGAGVYAQPAAPITMVLLAVLTAPALWLGGCRLPRHAATFAACFALPVLAMVGWFVAHPDTYRDTMERWAIMQAHIRFPLDLVRAFVNWNTLGTRTSLYWSFFDPSWLFFSRADRAGVLQGEAPLLLPLAVLVPVGIARCLKDGRRSLALVLIGGLLVAPLAACTFGEPYNIAQSLTVVPFMVLLATIGVERVLAGQRSWPMAGFALIALVPIQFTAVYFRYLAR